MKISYDRQVDALYILFLEEPFEVTTYRFLRISPSTMPPMGLL
jgi:hypothetical protein